MSSTISPAGAEATEPPDPPVPTNPSAPDQVSASPRPRVRRVLVTAVPPLLTAEALPPPEAAHSAGRESPLLEIAAPPEITRNGNGHAPALDVDQLPSATDIRPPAPNGVPARRGAALRQRLRTDRGVIGGGAAAILGGVGEALLFPVATRGVGALVLAVAMAVAALAWRDMADTPLLSLRAEGLRGLITWQSGLVVRLVGIAGAVGLGVEGILAWLLHPDEIFGLQGVFWVASMALLLLSCARWYPRTQREADLGPPWTRAEALAFAGIIVLSFVTHLGWLDEIPWRFHFDEAIAYTESMRFYKGPMISMFTTTWWNTSLPSMWFPFTAGLMYFVGPGLVGVRLGVALIGAVTVIPVYGFARLAWGRTAALVAAFAVAVSATYIHYSRVSIINITTPFWWALCFYFLLRGLRSRRPGDFVWAGLLAGTSMYTYYGTRLLPYLLLAFGGYLLLFHFRATRERLGHLALVWVGFFVGFGPLIGYFLRHPEMWAGRGLSTLNVPPVIPSTWEGLVTDWNILAPLVAQNFLSLSVIPSRDTVWYAPFFLPPEAMLLLLGAGVLLWRWRQPAAFLTLLWALSVILSGGTLLDSSTIPNFAHWSPAVPALFLALALPVALWLNALRRGGPRRWVLGSTMVAVGLVLLAGTDAYAYLVTYPARVPPDKSLEAVQGRYLASVGPNTIVRIVGNSWQTAYPDTVAMMAPTVPIANFFNPSRGLPLVGDPDHNLSFMFYNERDYLSVFQEYYPGGTVKELRTPDGNDIATAYEVPAQVAMARYGVATRVTGGAEDKLLWQGQMPTVGALPAAASLSYPLTVTWNGLLYVHSGALVKLRLDGTPAPDHPTLGVLNSRHEFGTPLQFDFGWTPFSITVRLNRPGAIHLLLQLGDAPAGEVPQNNLWPSAPNAGLAAAFNGALLQQRVDPFIGSSMWLPPPNSYVHGQLSLTEASTLLENVPMAPLGGGGNPVRWAGEVFSENGGTYLLEVATGGRAQVMVKNITVINLCDPPAGNTGAVGSIRLDPGWNPIRVNFQSLGSGIKLLWTRPDGGREIIPPSRLRHNAGATTTQPWPQAPSPITCATPP